MSPRVARLRDGAARAPKRLVMNAMRERICEWFARGRRVAVATVIRVTGSAPFPPGTAMAVNEDGELFGTISNGCVESAIAGVAHDVFAKREPVECSFDSEGDGLTGVSLQCGGTIDVLVEEISPDRLPQIFAGKPAVIQLIIAGAGDYARALADLCYPLDYAISIVDPRPAFTRPDDVTHASVHCAWPDEYLERTPVHENAALLMLSHDVRYDARFLAAALASPAFYVGAMGSRRTQQARLERLIALGVSKRNIERLHAPVGLDLGGRTPHETAIAILAEIIAVYYRRAGAPLKGRSGPIHDLRPDTATDPQSEARGASNSDDRASV